MINIEVLERRARLRNLFSDIDRNTPPRGRKGTGGLFFRKGGVATMI